MIWYDPGTKFTWTAAPGVGQQVDVNSIIDGVVKQAEVGKPMKVDESGDFPNYDPNDQFSDQDTQLSTLEQEIETYIHRSSRYQKVDHEYQTSFRSAQRDQQDVTMESNQQPVQSHPLQSHHHLVIRARDAITETGKQLMDKFRSIRARFAHESDQRPEEEVFARNGSSGPPPDPDGEAIQINQLHRGDTVMSDEFQDALSQHQSHSPGNAPDPDTGAQRIPIDAKPEQKVAMAKINELEQSLIGHDKQLQERELVHQETMKEAQAEIRGERQARIDFLNSRVSWSLEQLQEQHATQLELLAEIDRVRKGSDELIQILRTRIEELSGQPNPDIRLLQTLIDQINQAEHQSNVDLAQSQRLIHEKLQETQILEGANEEARDLLQRFTRDQKVLERFANHERLIAAHYKFTGDFSFENQEPIFDQFTAFLQEQFASVDGIGRELDRYQREAHGTLDDLLQAQYQINRVAPVVEAESQLALRIQEPTSSQSLFMDGLQRSAKLAGDLQQFLASGVDLVRQGIDKAFLMQNTIAQNQLFRDLQTIPIRDISDLQERYQRLLLVHGIELPQSLNGPHPQFREARALARDINTVGSDEALSILSGAEDAIRDRTHFERPGMFLNMQPRQTTQQVTISRQMNQDFQRREINPMGPQPIVTPSLRSSVEEHKERARPQFGPPQFGPGHSQARPQEKRKSTMDRVREINAQNTLRRLARESERENELRRIANQQNTPSRIILARDWAEQQMRQVHERVIREADAPQLHSGIPDPVPPQVSGMFNRRDSYRPTTSQMASGMGAAGLQTEISFQPPREVQRNTIPMRMREEPILQPRVQNEGFYRSQPGININGEEVVFVPMEEAKNNDQSLYQILIQQESEEEKWEQSRQRHSKSGNKKPGRHEESKGRRR